MSPFPPLEWDDSQWTGSVTLPAWAGSQSRLGAYGSQSSATTSGGTAFLEILVASDEETPPSPEQSATYEYLLEHQEAIRDSIIQAIFATYPEWQQQYGYDDEEAKEFMPDLESPDQLIPLIGLSTVRIFPLSKSGLAYVGFEFGCTWDEEHGLGAMMHANRVVKIGGADTAILQWIVEKDVLSG